MENRLEMAGSVCDSIRFGLPVGTRMRPPLVRADPARQLF